MIIEIPDKLEITLIEVSMLKEAWRDFRDYSLCQPVGDKWYREGKTPLLKAPSAVLVDCYNYVINCEHSDYKKVQLIETTDLVPDERIENILKKYREK